MAVPNEGHQADLLFLPHDRVGRKTFSYALTVVDVASCYKEAEPLTSKTAAEVADALSRIQLPLKWPKLLQVDLGREFMGAVSQLLAKHSVQVRRGRVDIHRDQGIVERWNRPSQSGCLGTNTPKRCASLRVRGQQSGWLGCKKPSDAIEAKTVAQKPSSIVPDRPVDPFRCWCSLSVPAQRAGGRSTDPVWSLEVFRLGRSVTMPDEPVLYYLQEGPPRGFVREELLIVPPDTQLPPDGVHKR